MHGLRLDRSRGPWAYLTWPLTICGAMCVCVWGGGDKGGTRTFIAFWTGVRVVQLGPTGMAMRVAFGEPFSAICCGGRTCGGGALLRVDDMVMLSISGENLKN